MQIKYINAAGGGFNGRREIAEGTTIQEFFVQVMPNQEMSRFNVRVNNSVAVAEQVLLPNDLVSIIPGKYDGGVLGTEFVANLQAAARLGAVVRQAPNIVEDLRAVNDLGTAIRAVPDLAGNIAAVIQFVRAVGATDTTDEDGVVIAPRPAMPATLAAPVPAEPSTGRRVIRPGTVQLVTGYGLAHFEPAEGTILQLFDRVKPGHRAEDYVITVNGSTVDPDYILIEGDSVIIRSLDEVRGRVRTGTNY